MPLENDVNKLYPILRDALEQEGTVKGTRGGLVLGLDSPITWGLTDPMNRVLHLRPKANPFFHLFEAMWMLAGRDLVHPLCHFIPSMKDFTDDGIHVAGAYGARWFEDRQLPRVINHLIAHPETRRAVLAHWSQYTDLDVVENGGKDVPCNTHILFARRPGHLDMTVCNRSNDLLWGAMGANVVHFSFLHEYVAEQVGTGLGTFWTFSNNLHMYVDEAAANLRDLDYEQNYREPAKPHSLLHHRLGSTDPGWSDDLEALMKWSLLDFPGADKPVMKTSWFKNVVMPMIEAWGVYRRWGRSPLYVAEMIEKKVLAADWALAGSVWMRGKA